MPQAKYDIHPAANIFPMMTDAELAGLIEDIRENGQRESATFWNGQLIDGRNRALACERIGIELEFGELDGDVDPVKWVVSHNLHRRHLTPSQRSMVAVKLKELLEPASKGRQQQSTSKAGKASVASRNGESNVVAKLPTRSDSGKSRDQAAEAVGISGKLVDAAEKVTNKGTPELNQAVTSGAIKVTRAAKIADLPQPEQQAAITEAIEAPRKVRSEKDRISDFIKGCDEKIVVARALYDSCLPGIRKTILRQWEDWVESEATP